MLMPLVLGLACGGAPASDPEPAPDCAALTPQSVADRCWMDVLLTYGHDQVPEVVETAGRIQDPVIRGAAVFGWIELNADKAAPTNAAAVCDVLEGPNRRVCDRRQKSHHLQR